MRTHLAIVLLVMAVAGCSPLLPQGATPDQRLYALEGGYRVLLDLAVAYKEACDARPPAFQTHCRPVVERLRAIDRRVAALQSPTDRVSPQTADLRVTEAALAEMQRLLVSATTGEDIR